jgi:short-subunit dehydrogenase
MASLVGRISTPMLGWYASTKHAIEGLSDALRMEVRQFGIDVVIIEPGPVRTEFETVAFAAFERIDHEADYRAMADAFEKYNRRLYAKAPGPASTVNAVLTAIHATRPRRRYATTRLAKLAPCLRRWLGDAFFDWAMLRAFSTTSRP